MAVFQAKVPAALASGIICLVVGGGLGAVIMSSLVDKPAQQANASPSDSDNTKSAGDLKGGGGDAGAKGGKGAKGAKGGGQRGPNSKMQLAQLVGRLDTLTKQSLHVELSAEHKKQVKELLADLGTKDAITEEEAKAKLDALLKLLEGQRATLEAAGFRWPGGGGVGGPPPNPFKEGENAEHLKSLQATVGKSDDNKPTHYIIRVTAADNGTIEKMTLTEELSAAPPTDLGANVETFRDKLVELKKQLDAQKKTGKITLELGDKLIQAYVVQLVDTGIRSGFTDISPVPIDTKKR